VCEVRRPPIARCGVGNLPRVAGASATTDAVGLVERLSAIEGRTACTDAERRAGRLLARELRARGQTPRSEAFWTRPAATPVHSAIAGALGVVGSVISVDHQVLAVALLGAALALELLGVAGWPSPLWLLMTSRASQNVIVRSPAQRRVRLIVTAPVDVPRQRLLFGGGPARSESRARRALRGRLAGPHAALAAALVALIALAALRAGGGNGPTIGILQILPTAMALLAAAGFAEAAVGSGAPGANANASAVAVALALVDRLNAVPPRHLAVDLVLAGAGEAEAAGMRHHIRGLRRAGLRRDQVVVLHLAPSGAGSPVWWTRDGRLLALRYHSDLVALCQAAAADERHLRARPHESRGASGAHAARLARWPAIAIGCVDDDGLAPHAGEPSDLPTAIDRSAMDAALEFCLALVARLDAYLGA
jgi:hypothetical protein